MTIMELGDKEQSIQIKFVCLKITNCNLSLWAFTNCTDETPSVCISSNWVKKDLKKTQR